MRQDSRGDLDADALVRLVLVLAVVWLVLEVVGEAVVTTLAVVEFLGPAIGVVLVVLAALWLLDRI